MKKALYTTVFLTLFLTLLTLSACQSTTGINVSTLHASRSLNSTSAPGSDLQSRVLLGYQGALTAQKIQHIEQQYDVRFVNNLSKIGVAVFQRIASGVTNYQVMGSDPRITFSGADQSLRRIVGEPQIGALIINRNGNPLTKRSVELNCIRC